MIGRSIAGLLFTAALSLGVTAPARADDVADFYRGKRISLVIGYGTGGGDDLYARMLGRFMGDHIPGKPTIIAQNMPGAGSRGAANWLYKVAPRDGTVIATLGQTTPTDQALGQPGVQFDGRKFSWIGNVVVVNNLLFVFARSGVASLDQAKNKPLAIGATGASSLHRNRVRQHAIAGERDRLNRHRRHRPGTSPKMIPVNSRHNTLHREEFLPMECDACWQTLGLR
jgi:tripartite-type tricarboxylate transporter receptor subunit TctC